MTKKLLRIVDFDLRKSKINQKTKFKAASCVFALALLPYLDGRAQEAVNTPAPAGTKLEDVVVTAPVSSEDAAAAVLAEIPGAARSVDEKVFRKGRVGTTADILAYQPGIYAQETAGGDGIKLSVRGSAINRGAGNSYRSGIYIAFDGLPVTVPGGAPYELQEPWSFKRAEFLLGANGFEYGPRNFGGAINFVSPTGLDTPGFEVRQEVGSFGYFKEQLSYGGASGPFDYYVSLTETDRRGFQTQSTLRTFRLASNFGWKINDYVENRLFFRYGYTNHESPGSLTKDQIENHRDAAAASSIQYDSHRVHPGTYWVGDKLTIKPDSDSSIELGLLWHNYPIHIYSSVLSKYFYDTITGQIKYKRTDSIAGHTSNTTLGVIASYNVDGWYDRYDLNPTSATYKKKTQKNDFSGSSDNVILALNDFSITNDLWLTTGVSLVQTIRQNVEKVGVYNRYRRNDIDFAPRLGLRYNFTPEVQVYSNVSRTVEPRNDWAGSYAVTDGWAQRDIRNQTATTWEIGARAKFSIFEGTLSYYYADIRNALLSVETYPGSGVTTETNASPTRHQGIEVGLNTVLWQEGGFDPATIDQSSSLSLRQTYTWSDFRYKHDYLYGKNRLPGVPEHYYQAELFYQHASGFYAGFNVKTTSEAWVDYANSYKADGWVILGAKVGYEPPGKKWNVYVDIRNLTDERYAASISPVFQATGDTTAAFSPGDPFSIIGGFAYRF